MSMIDDLRFFDEGNTREPALAMVSIPVKMFADLLDTKARVNVLLDFIAVEKSISTINIAVMLGNSELATYLKEEDKKYWDDIERRISNKVKGEQNEDTETNS